MIQAIVALTKSIERRKCCFVRMANAANCSVSVCLELVHLLWPKEGRKKQPS